MHARAGTQLNSELSAWYYAPTIHKGVSVMFGTWEVSGGR